MDSHKVNNTSNDRCDEGIHKIVSSQILVDAADALVASGKTGIFTPMFLVVAVKGDAKKKSK